jgi:hypothetical protein
MRYTSLDTSRMTAAGPTLLRSKKREKETEGREAEGENGKLAAFLRVIDDRLTRRLSDACPLQ